MDAAEKKLLSNIIDYLNKIEDRINVIEANVSQIKDLELVNKLDIINLKNEIEQVKLIKGVKSDFSFDEIIIRLSELENKVQKIEGSITSGKKPSVCDKCGYPVPEGAKFCPNCGEKVK